jgi:hypothetical protein
MYIPNAWRSRVVTALFLLIGFAGCGATNAQRLEMEQWELEAKRNNRPEVRYIEHLSPSRAASLGFLPFGVGGFYVHRPGLAVSGILCWPLSITWLPAVAYQSAHRYNYEDFRGRIQVMREQLKADAPVAQAEPAMRNPTMLLERLDEQRRQGRVSEAEYQQIRQQILQRLAQ